MPKIYGNENQKQAALIQQVNQAAEPIRQIKNGMCYMLSLNWIVRCLTHPPMDLIKEFDLMTDSANIGELRQTAQNFRSYVQDVLQFKLEKHPRFSPEWVRVLCAQAQTFVKMLSRDSLTAVPHLLAAKLTPMTYQLRNLTIHAGTEAYLIVFFFPEGKKICGHAIAMVSVNDGTKDLYYLYDPNTGVIVSNKIKTLTDLLKIYGKQDESKVCIYIIAVQ